MKPAACFKCRFYELLPENTGKEPRTLRGRCKRLPPVTIVLGNSPLAVQPLVSGDDWCGAFDSPRLATSPKSRE